MPLSYAAPSTATCSEGGRGSRLNMESGPFPGMGRLMRGTELEEGNRRLKKELAIAQEERDILKKLWPSSPKHRNDISVHPGAHANFPCRDDVPSLKGVPDRILSLARKVSNYSNTSYALCSYWPGTLGKWRESSLGSFFYNHAGFIKTSFKYLESPSKSGNKEK
ncbi:hypothetical protein MTJW_14140 [Moorella thermoacetica]|nr:hypothetical protein MTJW_14140 [Moorella thermoacetica]